MKRALKYIVPIGSMDQRIDLVYYTEAYDDFNEQIKTDVDIATNLYASHNYKSSDEKDVNSKETVTQGIEFIIRYRTLTIGNDTISPTDKEIRIRHEGTLYDVTSIEILGRKRFIKYICKIVS